MTGIRAAVEWVLLKQSRRQSTPAPPSRACKVGGDGRREDEPCALELGRRATMQSRATCHRGITCCIMIELPRGCRPPRDGQLCLPGRQPVTNPSPKLYSSITAGHPEMDSFAYLVASGLCIGAIACLASQKTARLGNILVRFLRPAPSVRVWRAGEARPPFQRCLPHCRRQAAAELHTSQ